MSKQPILKKGLFMLKKTIIIGLFVTVLAIAPSGAPPLGAVTVSVLVMETGSPGEQSGQYSIMWENGLLEVLFETGHIVTNSPRITLIGKPADGFPDEAEKDYEGAKLGELDYFLIAIVDYALSNVSLRLFDTNSPKMIREQKYTVTTFRNIKEENDKIKTAAGDMAVYLK
jgi:hypothetical protein